MGKVLIHNKKCIYKTRLNPSSDSNSGRQNKTENSNDSSLKINKLVKRNGSHLLGKKLKYKYEKYAVIENKTIESNTYTTRYDYDIQGRIKSLTYPDGEVVTYSYNDGGTLKSIISDKQTYIANIIYDEYGQRTQVNYGNGIVQNYSYDKYTRLLDNYTTTDKKGNKLLDYKYTFDTSGNITNISENVSA